MAGNWPEVQGREIHMSLESFERACAEELEAILDLDPKSIRRANVLSDAIRLAREHADLLTRHQGPPDKEPRVLSEREAQLFMGPS